MEKARIEGISDVLKMLDGAPEEMLKATKKALGKAASSEARRLRKQVPDFAKGIVKSSTKSLRSGDVSASFGMFVDSKWQDQSGRKGPDWFHAYWKNYGTLSGRDPAHQFDQPVKGEKTANARRRRNNTGQMHENFFERAITGWEERCFAEFKKSMKEQGYDIG